MYLVRFIVGVTQIAVVSTLAPIATLRAEMRAGVAKVTLPVGDGVRLSGYPDKRIASGTHDPLEARILLFRTATQSVAIVASDLYSFQSRRISEEALRTLHVGTVLFAASGSRSAPGTDEERAQAWVTGVEDAILTGLRQASASMFPAQLSAGSGSVDLAYNIRLVDEQGSVRMLWRNPERKATGPLWNTVPVWQITSDTGEPRALLYGVACPASVVGSRNRQLSGDYPGYASRRIESILGGGTVALFLQGAAGDLAPFVNESTFSQAESVGEEVAREVARISRISASSAKPVTSLDVYRTRFDFHERWGNRKPILVESATVVLNRAFALVAFPGVPFVEHQIALADRSPVEQTLLAGHTQTGNGEWTGVLPTIRAAAEGGFGASYATRLEVGAGEAILDAALVNIYRSIGRLDDLPRGVLVVETPPEGKPRR